MGRHGLWRTVVWAVAAFIALGLVAATIAWAMIASSPDADPLRFEIAKSAIQVVSVAVVGGLLSMVTYMFQERRSEALRKQEEVRAQERQTLEQQRAEQRLEQDRQRAEQRREHDRRHSDEMRAQDERRAESRRMEDMLRDRRAKEDEAVREALVAMIRSYNRVKRARRLLSARTSDGGAGTMTLAVYDEYIEIVMDEQLEFEHLKRLARAVPILSSISLEIGRDVPVSLHDSFSSIEKFLNKVLDEYKEQRREVASSEHGLSMHRLPRVQQLLHGDNFWARVATNVRLAEEALRAQLMRPLVQAGSARSADAEVSYNI